MNILAIIQDTYSEKFGQCRALLPLNGRTFLEEILSRLKKVPAVDDVVLATSDRRLDDPLDHFAAGLGLERFRGSPRDVLSRTLLPIERYRPQHVIRVHGSSPFLDPGHLTAMIDLHLRQKVDLTTCECRNAVVQGLGAEVIRSQVIEEISRLGLTDFQREFHTQFLKQNPDRYIVAESQSKYSRPWYSLSVGNRRDYVLVQEIAARLNGNAFEQGIVELLDKNPHLVEINSEPEKPREVGLEKLLIFPDKLLAVTRVAAGESELDCSYPISVEISLTDACNLGCIWCSDRGLRLRENATMSKKTAFALVDDLHQSGTHGIVIEGGGEPTLHPDFDKIVEYIHAKGISLGLITNGVRPITEATVKKFEWIRVSLDAGTAQEYKFLKKADVFDRVIDNINTMTRLGPVVGVGYVLTRHNHTNLENLVYLLQKMNISYLQIRPVVDHADLLFEGDISYLKSFTYEQFPIMLDALHENACRGNSGLPCSAHSLTSSISSSGNVFLCGRLNIYDWFEPLGNVNTEPFRRIWTGAKRLAQATRVGDPDFCSRYCPQCRITKFNKALETQRRIKTRHFI